MQTLPQLDADAIAVLRAKHLAIPAAGRVSSELGQTWLAAVEAFRVRPTAEARAQLDAADHAYRAARRRDDRVVQDYVTTERRLIARARRAVRSSASRRRAPARCSRAPRRARPRARRSRIRATADPDGPSSSATRHGGANAGIIHVSIRDRQGREGEAMSASSTPGGL